MRRTVRRIGICLIVAALLGAVVACGRLEAHYVLTGTPAAPYSGDVRVVLEGAPEPEGVQEVAIVQAVGTLQHARLEDLVEALKGQARALGCDAVVHVRVDQGSSTASASGVAGRLGAPAAPAR
jgi:hypothetical protein